MGLWKNIARESGTGGWKALTFEGSANNDYFSSIGIRQPTYTIITPQGTYYNNKTFVVIQGTSVNPYAYEYNHTTCTWSSAVLIGTNPLSSDSHGAPSILRDSQGKLHIFYGCHGTAGCGGDTCYIQHAKSNSADNISAWTDKGNICAQKATYPKPILIGSDIYLFYRLHVSGNWFKEVYSKSTDHGENWGSANSIIDFGTGYAIYVGQVEEEGTTKIHFSWAPYNYAASEHRNVYHAYLKLSDMHMYGMDGTDMGTTISIAEADANCRVRNSGTNATSCCPRVHVCSGIPYIIFLEDDSGYKVKYTKWTGSAWSSPVTITSTGTDNDCLDFIVHSSTNIEAYIVSVGDAGIGGDIEKWTYNGSTWSKSSTILSRSTYSKPLAWVNVVKNCANNFKFLFSEWKDDYTTGLKVFGHGNSGFVRSGQWRSLAWESAAIDIGGACTDRSTSLGSATYTLITWDNPANASGTLTNICLYLAGATGGIKVGVFEKTGTNTFKCRSVHTIGDKNAGQHNITVSMSVQTGDYIGIYYASGLGPEYGGSGGGVNLSYIVGDKCVVNNESTYTLLTDRTPFSVYGT